MHAAPLLLVAALLCPALLSAETLDLDADDGPEDTDAAIKADFVIPIKINGQEIDCGFWKGQDPADVAIEFGTLHQLDGKKIGRLRKALTAEAETRGLIAKAEPAAQVATPAPLKSDTIKVRSGMPIALANFNDRWASMQLATVKFAHSPFCQKFCTKENGGILGVALSIAMINMVWALYRYKGRKNKVKAKMEALEEQQEEQRVAQRALFENCVSASEADALRGAFKNQIKGIHRREQQQEASKGGGEWSWPSFGNRRTMKE